MTRRRNPLKSGLAGIADQSLIAITNLLLAFFAAQGGVNSLGSFALVGALYFSSLILMRALLAEPYMAIGDTGARHFYGTVSLAFSLIGCALTGVIAVAFFPMDIEWYLIPLLVLVLSMFEFARIKAYVEGRPGAALVGSIAALLVVACSGFVDTNFSPERWLALTWYWLAGGLLGYVFLIIRTGGLPAITRGAWSWFIEHLLPRGKSLVLDSAGIVLVAHVGLFMISHNGSLTDVASVRAVTALLSPVSLVFTGLTISLTPALARSDPASHRSTLRTFWILILTVSLIATVVVTTFGPQIIALVFGLSAVPEYRTLLVAVSSVVVFSLGAPLLAQVRVRGAYSIVAAVRLVTGIMTVVALAQVGTGNYGLLFFSLQLGQAVLILVGAWFALRPPRTIVRAEN